MVYNYNNPNPNANPNPSSLILIIILTPTPKVDDLFLVIPPPRPTSLLGPLHL
jgi:hypothetical protein